MKKILAVIIFAALLTGCTGNEKAETSETEASTTTEQSVTQTSAETSETSASDEIDEAGEDLITGNYNNDTVTEEEAAMGVTAEKKAAFIEEYTYDVYDVGMQCLPFYLNYSANVTQGIAFTDFSDITDNYTVEEISIKSSLDGHDIPADLISDGNKDKDTVIVIHGLGENRRQTKDHIEIFLKMGYNVLAYDQRSAGDNKAPYSTYGILEHYDTQDYVKYLRGEINDKKIILFGKSMGGITAAMALGDEETANEISYVILDSPVGSFRGMLEKNLHGIVPDEYIEDTLTCDDLFMNYFLDISFEQGEAAEYVKDTKVPVLIFSSKADDIVPYEQEQGIYDAIEGDNKYIYVDEEATHCGLFYTKTDMYKQLVADFLDGKLV